MLKIYLTSVIIYMIIIYCETKIFKNNIIKNGWATEGKKSGSALGTLFCFSAVPLLRLLFVVVLCVMFTYPKEKVDAWIEKNKKEE